MNITAAVVNSHQRYVRSGSVLCFSSTRQMPSMSGPCPFKPDSLDYEIADRKWQYSGLMETDGRT